MSPPFWAECACGVGSRSRTLWSPSLILASASTPHSPYQVTKFLLAQVRSRANFRATTGAHFHEMRQGITRHQSGSCAAHVGAFPAASDTTDGQS
ncbi:uncharacterized protein BJX67DRAFT_356954 [Aspergillus lucknowensis]|uniref:Uncharacterized protein n=1 Tax=Aspergillus lucknowensis TaxID=176173 RepID=A0ABR4LRH4_9EURO